MLLLSKVTNLENFYSSASSWALSQSENRAGGVRGGSERETGETKSCDSCQPITVLPNVSTVLALSQEEVEEDAEEEAGSF